MLRVKARGHRDLVTVVGHTATITAGEWIQGSGRWVSDRRGPPWSTASPWPRVGLLPAVPRGLTFTLGKGNRPDQARPAGVTVMATASANRLARAGTPAWSVPIRYWPIDSPPVGPRSQDSSGFSNRGRECGNVSGTSEKCCATAGFSALVWRTYPPPTHRTCS